MRCARRNVRCADLNARRRAMRCPRSRGRARAMLARAISKMRKPSPFRIAFAAACLALALTPRLASAQVAQNLDLPKFDPSFAGDRFFGVPSPYTPSDGVINVHGGVLLDYAHNPLVIASEDDETPLSCGEPECSLVEHQLFLHLNVTGTLFDRLAVNLDMPFALYQAGEGEIGAACRHLPVARWQRSRRPANRRARSSLRRILRRGSVGGGGASVGADRFERSLCE